MPEKTTYSDEMLARRIVLHDESAFELLYERHSRQLLSFAASYLPDFFDAEEIVQSLFVELWEKREQIDPSRFSKSYLYRIAVNKVFNLLKQQVVEKKYLQYLSELETDTANETERKIYREELAGIVEQLLMKLPEQQRKIFYMSRWDGLSHKEIADRLQISVRTVENQVYRAFKYIRENIQTDYFILFLISDLLISGLH